MTNLLVSVSNTTHKHRVLMTVVVVGVQVLLPGCGIPKLHRAQPGAPLPPRFDDANNLDYLRDNPGSGSGYYMGAARAGGFQPPDILASFKQPENWVKLNDDDADKATTIHANYVDFANGVVPDEAANADTATTLLASFSQPAGGLVPDITTDSDDAVPNLLGAPPHPDAAAPKPDDVFGNLGDGTASWENSSYLPWNEFFDDPLLATLIDQALVGNQELKMLTQEVQIASLQIQSRRGAYLPFVNFGAGAGVDKPGRYTRAGAVEDQLSVKPGRGFPEPLPDFLIAANLSWQIDIWRQLRNARDAAALRFLGTRDGQTYIVTRLVAEIAENYYELLMLDTRLEILDQTIAIQQQSLKVAESQKAAGTGTELGVQRFVAEVRKNQSEKLIVHQRIIEVENRINFLCGRFPQHVERDASGYIDRNLHALSVGVPSQLLQNRPDIRQAERELEAAGLDIQVARARFFPTPTITSGVGYQAFNAKYLFTTPESLVYNVAGDLVAPLINKLAIKADYLSANATQLEAIYKYQRTVLNAFTEVINRMAKVQNYGQSIEIKKQQVQALQTSVDVATRLFDAARADYVDVLFSQRDLMDARTVLVETKQQQLSAIVNAYQALGGGGVVMNFQP